MLNESALEQRTEEQPQAAADAALPGTLRVWARRAARAGSSNTSLAMLDQAVVSGSNFLTTILVGRVCGADELGLYSLGFTLVLLAAATQESLVTIPFTIYHRRLEDRERADYAGTALVQYVLLSAFGAVLLLLAAGSCALGLFGAGMSRVLLTLGIAIPFLLLREFGRRLSLARLHVRQTLTIDVAVSTLQISGLALLALGGVLSAALAHAMVGLACAVVGGVWLLRRRSGFAIRRERLPKDVRRNWSLGSWVFANSMTSVVNSYVVHWLLAILVGTAATGVFAACATVVLLSNPLLLGINNVLAPQAAAAWAEDGSAGVRRVVVQTTLLLAGAMSAFCLVVILFGDTIVYAFYGGDFLGHQATITLLALATFVLALGIAPEGALWTLERPDVSFQAGLLGLVVLAVVGSVCASTWGVVGATAGMLCGNLVGTGARWAAFLRLVRPQIAEQSAV